MFNSNIGPNLAPLRDISLQNLGDLDFDLSRSLKVRSNGAVGLPIYDFLLMSNSNYVSNWHRLGVRATQNFFLLSLIIRTKFRHSHTCPFPGAIFCSDFFSKSNGFVPGSEGRLPPKMKLIGSVFFLNILLTDTQTQSKKPRHAKHRWGLMTKHVTAVLLFYADSQTFSNIIFRSF